MKFVFRGRRPRRPTAAQRKIASPGEKLSEKRSQRTDFLTEEECGRSCLDFGYAKTFTNVLSRTQPESRSDMLYCLSAFRPHSSSDPLRGPPEGELPRRGKSGHPGVSPRGKEFFPPLRGGGRSLFSWPFDMHKMCRILYLVFIK